MRSASPASVPSTRLTMSSSSPRGGQRTVRVHREHGGDYAVEPQHQHRQRQAPCVMESSSGRPFTPFFSSSPTQAARRDGRGVYQRACHFFRPPAFLLSGRHCARLQRMHARRHRNAFGWFRVWPHTVPLFRFSSVPCRRRTAPPPDGAAPRLPGHAQRRVRCQHERQRLLSGPHTMHRLSAIRSAMRSVGRPCCRLPKKSPGPRVSRSNLATSKPSVRVA